MKENQIIVFMNQEEFDEAVSYGIITSNCSEFGEGDFPYLQSRHEWFPIKNMTRKKSIAEERISMVQQSVLWSAVRDIYRPKVWYELASAVGRPMWVTDDKDSIQWSMQMFAKYIDSHDYKFQDTEGTRWNYAEPVEYEDRAVK